MDYDKQANDLLETMEGFRRARAHVNFFEHLQGELFVLYHIASHGFKTMPGIISKEMNVSSARVAAALNNLEQKGLVTRHINAEDRRQIVVEITEAGKDFVSSHRRLILSQVSKVLRHLGEEDSQHLVRIIAKLVPLLQDCHLEDFE